MVESTKSPIPFKLTEEFWMGSTHSISMANHRVQQKDQRIGDEVSALAMETEPICSLQPFMEMGPHLAAFIRESNKNRSHGTNLAILDPIFALRLQSLLVLLPDTALTQLVTSTSTVSTAKSDKKFTRQELFDMLISSHSKGSSVFNSIFHDFHYFSFTFKFEYLNICCRSPENHPFGTKLRNEIVKVDIAIGFFQNHKKLKTACPSNVGPAC
jgi:hypothetical protein